ncbi:hypothetical protein M2650_11830 [Luteimonas sp. SX5]|uniref:C-type lysozyme inhibitor domain-containing protein n=1 Tax=Luteimonas galliterrae TaxID=2940486 RepID=A0ABT0MKC0_9GAMM|nr:hypothetical protein [Luteimonas galliterrae]MCL1635313.1 hypothetical protein [Luteimonas galliterrae]
MRSIAFLLTICAAVLSLAGCKQAPAPEPAAKPAPIDLGPSQDPAVTASYVCDDAHRVDLVGERFARITLSDGQTVTIHYVPKSRPPSYMGRGLRFAIGEKAVMLIQNDGVAVHCKPIQ